MVIVTTAHQKASGIDLKKDCSEPASAKYTVDENRTTPGTYRKRGWATPDPHEVTRSKTVRVEMVEEMDKLSNVVQTSKLKAHILITAFYTVDLIKSFIFTVRFLSAIFVAYL